MQAAMLLVAVVLAVAAARFAQAFFVPTVAGILLSYALRPVVSAIERWRVPRMLGAGLVIVVLVGLVGVAAYAIRDDVTRAVAELPGAARKIRLAVVESTRESPGPISNVKEAAAELDRAAAEASGSSAVAVSPPPDPVTAHFQSLVAKHSSDAVAVGGELLLAVLLAFFLLGAGDTYRRKIAHLAGESLARRRVTVEVLNEIDDQIQSYLLTLLVANIFIGFATWGALAALRMPNAGMWGAFAGLLHVVPYAGTTIAGAGIGAAMFVHSDSLARAAFAAGTVVVIATIIGVGLTTWLQSRACRMHPVAVFIGVLFFGWLWGGWGLLLGLPILAVVKSVSDRVEALHPVSELLGA
jgi:predicted PurR-regulated permease PerM